jgi:hypothetical protein
MLVVTQGGCEILSDYLDSDALLIVP